MNRRQKIEKGKRKNFSRAFILPMCGINYKILPKNFINSYLDIDNMYAYIIFDLTEYNDIIFLNFLDGIKKNANFEEYSEDVDEVIIKLKIPEGFKEDFNKFINGKYSEFTEEYKMIIKRFFGMRSEKDTYRVKEYNVIYPQDFKKLQIARRLYDPRDVKEGVKNITEVLDAPDLNDETFKPLNILLEENKELITN